MKRQVLGKVIGLDYEEGDHCWLEGCAGALMFPKTENCSCFIAPPCAACTDKRLTCSECGAEVNNEN